MTIGWREWLSLPDMGVEAIKVKVDTGARSSALHAFAVEEYEKDNETWVRFSLHPLQRDSTKTLTTESRLADRRWVRSSTGRSTLRPVIRTRLRLGEHTWGAEVTLVRRDMMGFRMLLGRQAIRRRFVVDSGRSFLIGKLEK